MCLYTYYMNDHDCIRIYIYIYIYDDKTQEILRVWCRLVSALGTPGPAWCKIHPVHSKHGDECGAAGHLAESLFLVLF